MKIEQSSNDNDDDNYNTNNCESSSSVKDRGYDEEVSVISG
jgi:hypothetical protein